MLEIKVYVEEIDYDSLVNLLLPKVAEKDTKIGKIVRKHSNIVRKLLHRYFAKKGQEGTEKYLAELAEKKHDLLIETASEWAEKKNISLKIVDIDVKAVGNTGK